MALNFCVDVGHQGYRVTSSVIKVMFMFQPEVNVKTTVTDIGPYVFLTHYYQPYSVGFDIDVTVTVDSQEYRGW